MSSQPFATPTQMELESARFSETRSISSWTASARAGGTG